MIMIFFFKKKRKNSLQIEGTKVKRISIIKYWDTIWADCCSQNKKSAIEWNKPNSLHYICEKLFHAKKINLDS